MKIAIGSDHRGFDLKQFVMKIISEEGHTYHDFGCYSTESVDYPDIARPVAEAVARGDYERAILICDTGIGMSIVANKVSGIRAALCHNEFYAVRARLHNDANVLCLGTKEEPETIRKMVVAFLTTTFEGGRHSQRLDKIRAIEC